MSTNKTEYEKQVNKMPVVPDPLWPEGAMPGHLSVVQQQDKNIVAPYAALSNWKCEKCGTTVGQSVKKPELCNDCYVIESQNTAVAKKINADWMEQSKELGLSIFERQPEETAEEWRIWDKYRSYYPLKMPTWTELASALGVPVARILRASAKWSYRVRLVAWAQYTDDLSTETRIAAIKEMNDKQLGMAKNIQDKLKDAIDYIEPALLKPNEIVNLFKVATELERRVVEYVPDKIRSDIADTKSKQQAVTKAEDIAEVVSILQKAGVLDGKTIGIEQTTRIVAKEDDN